MRPLSTVGAILVFVFFFFFFFLDSDTLIVDTHVDENGCPEIDVSVLTFESHILKLSFLKKN